MTSNFAVSNRQGFNLNYPQIIRISSIGPHGKEENCQPTQCITGRSSLQTPISASIVVPLIVVNGARVKGTPFSRGKISPHKISSTHSSHSRKSSMHHCVQRHNTLQKTHHSNSTSWNAMWLFKNFSTLPPRENGKICRKRQSCENSQAKIIFTWELRRRTINTFKHTEHFEVSSLDPSLI